MYRMVNEFVIILTIIYKNTFLLNKEVWLYQHINVFFRFNFMINRAASKTLIQNQDWDVAHDCE